MTTTNFDINSFWNQPDAPLLEVAYDARTGLPLAIPAPFADAIATSNCEHGTWRLIEGGGMGPIQGWYIWLKGELDEGVSRIGVSTVTDLRWSGDEQVTNRAEFEAVLTRLANAVGRA